MVTAILPPMHALINVLIAIARDRVSCLLFDSWSGLCSQESYYTNNKTVWYDMREYLYNNFLVGKKTRLIIWLHQGFLTCLSLNERFPLALIDRFCLIIVKDLLLDFC